MFLVAAVLLVGASPDAVSSVETWFAAGSAWVVANFGLSLCLLLGVAAICMCMRLSGKTSGSVLAPVDNWAAKREGRPCRHKATWVPLQGKWELSVAEDSVTPEQRKWSTGSYKGRQVWRCVDPNYRNTDTFVPSENPNSADKIYRRQCRGGRDEPQNIRKGAFNDVTESVRAAMKFFSTLQAKDGHWPGDYGGPLFLMPGLIITCHISGVDLGKDRKNAMITYLRNHQQEDGGWGLHIESPSTMFGSVANYVAMRLLGVSENDEGMKRAREFIQLHGGAVGIPSWGKFWMSTLGVYDWSGLNPVPPELWLLPYWFPFHPGRMWCHCRMVYLPMSYIYGRRATGPITDLIRAIRSEIYTQPYEQVNWAAARNNVCDLDMYSPHTWVMKLLHKVLHVYEKFPIKFLRRRGVQFALAYMEAEDDQTNFVDIGPVNKTMNMLSAFFAHGKDSEQMRRHAVRLDDYLWVAEDGMKMQGYNGSQLWDTAFTAQAYLESGLTAEFKQTLMQVHQYVDDSQVRQNEDNYEAWFRHISKGGWPFSTADHGWPIADCTAEGLKTALGIRKLGWASLSEDRYFDAVNVILSFQNHDGGWATYENTRGGRWYEWLNPSEVFGDIMVDYSYVELSSACVTALNAFREQFPNHRATEVERSIRRGEAFVRSVQRPDGSWYGSWAVCFTYGAWFGVEALVAAGAQPDDDALIRACDFLASKQNPDGGWGENYMSCLTRRYCQNPDGSTMPNTAWALLALMGAKTIRHRAAVERGIKFLMANQLSTGDWEQEASSGIFSRTCAITYTAYRNCFPIWALGRYRTEYSAHVAAAAAAAKAKK